MDSEDQNDIIKKVKTAGNTGEKNSDEPVNTDDAAVESDPSDDTEGVEEQLLEKNDGIFLQKSKKLSIFAPEGSEESKFNKTIKTENTMNEPLTKPVVKPSPTETPVQPTRRNKPFLPRPNVQPDPKAIIENKK